MEQNYAPPQGHQGLRPYSKAKRYVDYSMGTIRVTYHRCAACSTVWRRDEDTSDKQVTWSVES
jgi:hypothetical protein